MYTHNAEVKRDMKESEREREKKNKWRNEKINSKKFLDESIA